MNVDLAPIFFVLMLSTAAVQSQITKGPVNALKSVGDNVTLECVTSSKNCDGVEWSKMEGAQSAKKVYQEGTILHGFQERYSVNSTGGCNLNITQLKISDSGRFSCVLLVDGREDTRSSVLVVISVRESCRSNVTNYALNQNDGYGFSTAINVPAKSVEPSNVALFFQNKAANETETTDESQPLTVKTTLTGIAGKENITQRVCRASFPPNTAANFDGSTGTLDVCTTQQLIVSYPVENVAVSPGPYYKGATVICTAKGYPYPTFKWTQLKSGKVVDGDTLVITGDVGDEYSCIATNILTKIPRPKTIVVEAAYEPICGPICVGAIVGGVVVVTIVVTFLVCWFVAWCPIYRRFRSITDNYIS